MWAWGLGFFLVLLLLGHRAFAGAISDIPQVGPHYRILTLEKNENPQNIAVIYTQLDKACHFLKDSKGQPVFDFYWLMDRTRYKPMNWLLKSGVHRRFEMSEAKATTSVIDAFNVKINDLKEMKTDLTGIQLLVETKKNSLGECEVENSLPLGASDQGSVVKVEKIFAEGKRTWRYPFREVVALTLQGVNLKSGEKVDRTYHSR